MYAVVQFLNHEGEKTSEISIVPLAWLHKDKCYWPIRTGNVPFAEFVEKQYQHKKSWPLYKVKVLFKTSSYSDAENRLSTLMDMTSEASSQSGASEKSLIQKETVEQIDSSSSEFDYDDNDNDTTLTNGKKLPQQSRKIYEPITNASMSSASLSTTTQNETSASHSNATDKILKTVVQQLTILNEEIVQNSILVRELIALTKNLNVQNLVPPENLPNFPINTMELFLEFDDRLANDALAYEYMKSRLACRGGSSIEDLTRRILKFVMENQVANQFNWKGRNKNPAGIQKRSFEKTKFMQVVYDAAKRNFPDNEKNDLLISNVVKEWLKAATTRMSHKKGQ